MYTGLATVGKMNVYQNQAFISFNAGKITKTAKNSL